MSARIRRSGEERQSSAPHGHGWRFHGVATAIVAAAFVLSGCASPPRDDAAGLSQMVRAARTRVDHEHLATYYEREARRLDQEALEHEKVARSYSSLSSGVNDGVWARHCANLAARLHGAARESLALAQLHAQVAAGAPE